MVFAAPGGRTCRVKVSERHIFQRVGLVVRRENLFHDELGPTIRIRWLLRMSFIDRNVSGLAISRTGRGEDKSAHPSAEQNIEKGNSLPDVVFEIEFGIGD